MSRVRSALLLLGQLRLRARSQRRDRPAVWPTLVARDPDVLLLHRALVCVGDTLLVADALIQRALLADLRGREALVHGGGQQSLQQLGTPHETLQAPA